MYPIVSHWGWDAGARGCYTNPDDHSTLEWTECNDGETTKVEVGGEFLSCYNCSNHGTGWLVDLGYNDFAGSGIVHLLGGTCALVGCYIIGPRKGKSTVERDDGKLKIGAEQGSPNKISGHSVPLAALGGFILIFGFLAFNGGSQVYKQIFNAKIEYISLIEISLSKCGSMSLFYLASNIREGRCSSRWNCSCQHHYWWLWWRVDRFVFV